MGDERDTFERLRRVFAAVFDDDELQLERTTTADQVEGWDSVSSVELMIALEKEFGVRFRTGEMASLEDVGQLIDRIERHRGT